MVQSQKAEKGNTGGSSGVYSTETKKKKRNKRKKKVTENLNGSHKMQTLTLTLMSELKNM